MSAADRAEVWDRAADYLEELRAEEWNHAQIAHLFRRLAEHARQLEDVTP